ncbi:MAG: transposase [Candidatus Zixiibacteriota bacterium]|nr:MAG: transposase [candidate division Zixibacteria bacterium]
MRRYDPEGRPIFVTCVTFNRAPILTDNVALASASYQYVRRLGAKAVAWVVLPDHFHAVIELGDASLSDVVRLFKAKFSGQYRSARGVKSGRIWQHRFWDHIIRDESDYAHHVDYIHYNPVHHGLVLSPFDYAFSSAHRWKRMGYYDRTWGTVKLPLVEKLYGE